MTKYSSEHNQHDEDDYLLLHHAHTEQPGAIWNWNNFVIRVSFYWIFCIEMIKKVYNIRLNHTFDLRMLDRRSKKTIKLQQSCCVLPWFSLGEKVFESASLALFYFILFHFLRVVIKKREYYLCCNQRSYGFWDSLNMPEMSFGLFFLLNLWNHLLWSGAEWRHIDCWRPEWDYSICKLWFMQSCQFAQAFKDLPQDPSSVT